jgi:subtilisin family serine protease
MSSRLEAVSAIALAALVVLAPLTGAVGLADALGSGTSDVFTDAVEDQRTWYGTWTPGEDVVTYGADGYPGWVVVYDNGSRDELEAWADSSSERTIQATDDDGNRMVISAPKTHVGQGLFAFGETLRDKSYVEKIGLNRRVEIDPIRTTDLKSKDAWERPAGGRLATALDGGASFDADGAAWGDEVNKSGLSEVRAAVDADNVAANGSGVTVAVLDTGLNYNQDLYGDRVPEAYNALTNESVTISDPANATASDYEIVADGSDSRHGSWVATAIAGNGSNPNATGVAPGATILPVKVLGDDGSGSTEAISRGLEYACEDADADIISMSLGSPVPSTQLKAEIQECVEDDGVSAIIVAAGNNRLTYRYTASPGDSTETVVTVAATDTREVNESESAYFSAVGPDPETGERVDVAAPGLKVVAEVDSGNRTLSGTSMATPIVSGTVALLLEDQPQLKGEPAAVLDELEAHAEPLEEAGTTEVGAGRVSASNLLDDVKPDQEQEEARNADAEGRDGANSAHSASAWGAGSFLVATTPDPSGVMG